MEMVILVRAVVYVLKFHNLVTDNWVSHDIAIDFFKKMLKVLIELGRLQKQCTLYHFQDCVLIDEYMKYSTPTLLMN